MASVEELLDELVRLKALELKNTHGNQNDIILDMSKVGLTPARIASLLGTTAATVSNAIQRSKKTPVGKKLSTKKGNDS